MPENTVIKLRVICRLYDLLPSVKRNLDANRASGTDLVHSKWPLRGGKRGLRAGKWLVTP